MEGVKKWKNRMFEIGASSKSRGRRRQMKEVGLMPLQKVHILDEVPQSNREADVAEIEEVVHELGDDVLRVHPSPALAMPLKIGMLSVAASHPWMYVFLCILKKELLGHWSKKHGKNAFDKKGWKWPFVRMPQHDVMSVVV